MRHERNFLWKSIKFLFLVFFVGACLTVLHTKFKDPESNTSHVLKFKPDSLKALDISGTWEKVVFGKNSDFLYVLVVYFDVNGTYKLKAWSKLGSVNNTENYKSQEGTYKLIGRSIHFKTESSIASNLPTSNMVHNFSIDSHSEVFIDNHKNSKHISFGRKCYDCVETYPEINSLDLEYKGISDNTTNRNFDFFDVFTCPEITVPKPPSKKLVRFLTRNQNLR